MDISTFPTVLQLQADDSSIQHAVTIVGKLVFDSNCPHALLLNQATLDYCCSSDDQPSHYSEVYRGYRFNEHGTKERYGCMLERNKVTLYLYIFILNKLFIPFTFMFNNINHIRQGYIMNNKAMPH